MKLSALLRLSPTLNVRNEKAGEDAGDFGTDLKFTGQVHLKDLRSIFHEDHGYAVLEALFDAEGNLATLAFGSFELTAKGSGIEATLTTEISATTVKLREVDVDQFALVPKLGRLFEISFRVKAHPSDTQLGELALMLRTDVKVDLHSRQGELRFGPAEEPDTGEATEGEEEEEGVEA